MFKQIYKQIKKYDCIVIARHIGVDPDALGSQMALKEAILQLFPSKKVYAVGNGSAKFSYIGKSDKFDDVDPKNSLLIVLDTPDLKRVDMSGIMDYAYKIKIDHHPFVETFCDLEYIDDKNSSTAQIILEFLYQCKFKLTTSIAEKIFIGLMADSNRLLFNTTSKTYYLLSKLFEDVSIDSKQLYQNLYNRPLKEIRLQGYISQNMIVTENGLAYIKLTNEILTKFQVDAASPGNMINNFFFIDEVLVWTFLTEDVRNGNIRITIRSKGPIVNHIAERYNGGGHPLAAGARVLSFKDADLFIHELDDTCNMYLTKED